MAKRGRPRRRDILPDVVLRALQRHGSIRAAARATGIPRSTFARHAAVLAEHRHPGANVISWIAEVLEGLTPENLVQGRSEPERRLLLDAARAAIGRLEELARFAENDVRVSSGPPPALAGPFAAWPSGMKRRSRNV